MSSRRPVFAVVHNIPSPYRLHLFRVLKEELGRHQIELHVHFMARGHADRGHWADERVADFQHTYWSDAGIRLGRKKWHLNPGLLARLAREPPAFLMVGGPWDSLTGVLASFLASRSVSIAWFEGNTRSPGRVRGVVRSLKEGLLRRFDFVAVPGEEGAGLAELIAGQRVRRRLALLPNLVDESRFSGQESKVGEMRSTLGVGRHERLAVWPARLIPEKGVVPFLTALDRSDLIGWRIVVLGDGPLRSQVERTIALRGLADSVRVLSPQPYEKMPATYAAADLFVLPSLSDPNPLSVVEAMHSGLPLVVSDRIGNLPEALRVGENGWALDPESSESIRAVLGKALRTPDETLRAMGRRSKELAVASWSSGPAVARFVATVVGP